LKVKNGQQTRERETIMPGKRKLNVAIFAVIIFAVAIIVITAGCGRDNDASVSPGDLGTDEVYVVVPDFIGYPVESLTSEFEALGLITSLYKVMSDEPVDTVLFVDRMGQLVPESATIEVLISGGSPDWELDTPTDPDSSVEQPDLNQEDPTSSEPSAEQPDSRPEAPSSSDQATERYEIWRMRFGGIDWLVLDEADDKILILSVFPLFDMAFNAEYASVTWEDSTIRSYLNNEFFNSFGQRDRARISETRVINNDRMTSLYGSHRFLVPAGNDTDDRIFLLSLAEVVKYFPTRAERVVRTLSDHPQHPDIEWAWVLRTPGYDNFTTQWIMLGGVDGNWDVNTSHAAGIRPAMWLYT